MVHPMHRHVVDMVHKATELMDSLLRARIDLDEYSKQLGLLDADQLLDQYREDFRNDVSLVYYLDALMLLSSLQHELDFQVAEYGANTALEDMRNLQELMAKFPHT
ncbi:MAG: hypothetical protein RDU20_02675 [Desulfomonilaceae bacterium]|nr:hypothetical protein [Desulfomonilaceae bacterium]